ncbi:regulator of nonsense transcripts UPF3-like isoform X2 [Phoenix dactylifera]|uniref:Regulator of nonsense transcripts UPF3-like isoform X2 n=1 Tax=Phoenix dactylifera TaxID=42345 RepID=A0A8B7CAV4_PHODC|nr:regulator of nonsense transcripts UPF3-like isoform X2 [Phoenix dactylifera]
MKDPFDRTKIVLRHLPPSISQSALIEQIDERFSGRYDWLCFRPGKASHKNQRYSRAYLNFKRPEVVVEFAEFFDGHIFVNEKGAQFKVLVEYAPSQHVPKPSSKKDGREGTISKDPEYLEFLEHLSKPEHLPSAEIQLERKEAERAGAQKETPIVTPLMNFVRQKLAAKNGAQRLADYGKLSKRAIGVIKRGSEKRRLSTSMYVLRDSRKNGSAKDKATYILMPRREEQQLPDKSIAVASASGAEALEDEFVTVSNGLTSRAVEAGKSKIVLLKGKEREGSHASGGLVQQQNVTTTVRSSPTLTSKQNQRLEASGRIIRTILSNEGGQSYMASSQPEQHMHTTNLEKDKRPARPPSARSISKDRVSSSSSPASISDSGDKRYIDDMVAMSYKHGSVSISDKHEKRTRNKDRPDRGVWAPLRRSDRSQSNDGTLSSSSEAAQILVDSLENVSMSQQTAGIKVADDNVVVWNAHDMPIGQGERKSDTPSASRTEEMKSHGGAHVGLSIVENGSHRHVGRRGPARASKDAESSLSISEVKHSKRGSSGYGSHERQVWVQKSGSAS